MIYNCAQENWLGVTSHSVSAFMPCWSTLVDVAPSDVLEVIMSVKSLHSIFVAYVLSWKSCIHS